MANVTERDHPRFPEPKYFFDFSKGVLYRCHKNENYAKPYNSWKQLIFKSLYPGKRYVFQVRSFAYIK
jgi:hypothetical protein